MTSVPAQTLPAPILVLGYTAFMLQLYFDFSGYSDMAIGIGCFFGLDLPENFDYPYLAQSVGEYWRRWHISLSSWFRDYLYIPLGGSRCGTGAHLPQPSSSSSCLTGLWHGAAWQYVAFGPAARADLVCGAAGPARSAGQAAGAGAPPVYAGGAVGQRW